MIPRTFDELLADLRSRLTRVERRLAIANGEAAAPVVEMIGTIAGSGGATWVGYLTRVGRIVSLSGRVTSSTTFTSGVLAGTIPADYRPATSIRVPIVGLDASFNPVFNSATINANGNINVNVQGAANQKHQDFAVSWTSAS